MRTKIFECRPEKCSNRCRLEFTPYPRNMALPSKCVMSLNERVRWVQVGIRDENGKEKIMGKPAIEVMVDLSGLNELCRVQCFETHCAFNAINRGKDTETCELKSIKIRKSGQCADYQEVK